MRENRIVYSAVAVPGEPDSDGEILTPEEIRHAAHAYLRDYRIVDPEHVCALGECYNVGKPVESYLTTEDMSVKSLDGTLLEFPSGTWVIGIDVTDDNTYEQIMKGEKRGVSLTAKRADGVTKSRVLIRDLGPDWVARTVSIVKNPAVPKARFFSIKSKELNSMSEEVQEEVTKGFDRVIEAIKSLREQTEEEPVEEDVPEAADESVKSEDETAEPETIEFVTHDELEAAKSEILEAIKSILPQNEEVIKEEDEDAEDEEDEKDKKIAELEAEIKRLKTATKSKGIPDHFQTEEKMAVKNLYSDDGRDLYGRVIRD